MKCKQCGADTPDDSVFCEQCGAKIKDSAPKTSKKKWALWIGVLAAVAAIAIVLVLLLCKKDYKEMIIGKWTLMAYSHDGEWRNMEPGENTFEFEEDGTVTKYEDFGADYDGTHEWSIDEDVLTIGDWDPWTITKITDNELEVNYTEAYGTEHAKFKKMD